MRRNSGIVDTRVEIRDLMWRFSLLYIFGALEMEVYVWVCDGVSSFPFLILRVWS